MHILYSVYATICAFFAIFAGVFLCLANNVLKMYSADPYCFDVNILMLIMLIQILFILIAKMTNKHYSFLFLTAHNSCYICYFETRFSHNSIDISDKLFCDPITMDINHNQFGFCSGRCNIVIVYFLFIR